MDKLQTIAPVGAVMDMLIMKKIEEDPDLELDIKDDVFDKSPLLNNENRIIHEDEDELENRRQTIDRFLNQRIDWASPYLEVDPAPLCIMENTQMSKIHFMFSMLNITQVIVIKDGSMVGIITKNEFLKKQLNTILSKPDPEIKDENMEFPI